MEIAKITKSPPIVTIDSPKNNRKIPGSSSLSNDDCNLILFINASIPTLNVTKNTTVADISISDHFKKY